MITRTAEVILAILATVAILQLIAWGNTPNYQPVPLKWPADGLIPYRRPDDNPYVTPLMPYGWTD